MDYTAGGVPVILLPDDKLTGSGFCGHALVTTTSQKGAQAANASGAAPAAVAVGAPVLALVGAAVAAMVVGFAL